jgi:phosphate transport system substrate-binding protein
MFFAWIALGLAAPAPIAGGSGTALPAINVLLEAYRAKDPAFQLTVAKSIGSSGAPPAVRDGAIAIGLMSRTFKPGEGLGLCSIPFATDLLVLAASGDVKTEGLSAEELTRIFAGTLTAWPRDPGTLPIHVVQREPGDSGTAAFGNRIPALKEVLAKAAATRRWQTVFHDLEMAEALMQTPGALGFFDLGAIRSQHLPLRVLALDGVAPTFEAWHGGRYPFAEVLRFVVSSRQAPPPALRAFLEYASSPAGQAALAAAGYGPPATTSGPPCPPAPVE